MELLRPVPLQAFTTEKWICADCSASFRPMIKTQPIWLRLSILAFIASAFFLMVLTPNHSPWLWVKVPWVAASFAYAVFWPFLFRALRSRRGVGVLDAEIHYGQIIPLCVHCGSAQVSPAGDNGDALNYTLDPD